MKKLFANLFLLLAFVSPAYVFAASPFLQPVKDVLGDVEIFINFLNWALPALAVLVFFLLVLVFIAGKMQLKLPFGLSAGDHGGKNIFGALIALAVLFSVYGLVQLIGAVFGIDTNRAKTITAPSLPQVGNVGGTGYYNGN